MCSKTTTFANLSEVATKRYILGLKSIISKVNIIHEKNVCKVVSAWRLRRKSVQ